MLCGTCSTCSVAIYTTPGCRGCSTLLRPPAQGQCLQGMKTLVHTVHLKQGLSTNRNTVKLKNLTIESSVQCCSCTGPKTVATAETPLICFSFEGFSGLTCSKTKPFTVLWSWPWIAHSRETKPIKSLDCGTNVFQQPKSMKHVHKMLKLGRCRLFRQPMMSKCQSKYSGVYIHAYIHTYIHTYTPPTEHQTTLQTAPFPTAPPKTNPKNLRTPIYLK